MIDVDHFKAVNDTHGHSVGDQVLEHVARQLAAALRVSDDVGRWGGEEFLALLPEADADEALSAAERLRAQVQHSAFPGADGPIAVTVSVGVVAVPASALADARIDDLVRRADAALYRAKALGRNRVERQ
jgi:diguanylate cyclase (GGDEF)-like protein